MNMISVGRVVNALSVGAGLVLPGPTSESRGVCSEWASRLDKLDNPLGEAGREVQDPASPFFLSLERREALDHAALEEEADGKTKAPSNDPSCRLALR